METVDKWGKLLHPYHDLWFSPKGRILWQLRPWITHIRGSVGNIFLFKPPQPTYSQSKPTNNVCPTKTNKNTSNRSKLLKSSTQTWLTRKNEKKKTRSTADTFAFSPVAALGLKFAGAEGTASRAHCQVEENQSAGFGFSHLRSGILVSDSISPRQIPEEFVFEQHQPCGRRQIPGNSEV